MRRLPGLKPPRSRIRTKGRRSLHGSRLAFIRAELKEFSDASDDTDAAVDALVARGAPLLSPAHDFLDGKLRSAWIAELPFQRLEAPRI
jgi:hypothetical protein